MPVTQILGIEPRSRNVTAKDKQAEETCAVPAVRESSPQLQLIAHEGTDNETVIPCRRAVTLIGARDSCKITLRHDRVSQVHAVIVHSGSELFVVDLLSRTGTRLNGLNADHEQLSNGDVLEIGPWSFRIKIESGPTDGADDIHPLDLEPSPRTVALEHKETGRVLQPNRTVCSIGRKPGCDIVIDDNRVSRCHAVLLTYFGQPAIGDLLSRNHTLVNDEPIAFRMLNDNDVITVGESSFIVHVVNAISDKVAGNGKAKGEAKPSSDGDEEHVPDLINIKETEGSQRWRVADSLDKIEKVAREG